MIVSPRWSRLIRRTARWIAIACGGGLLVLLVAAAITPLPPELRNRARHDESTRYNDSEGRLLREVRAGDSTRAQWMRLDQAGIYAPQAILAAEDRRFFHHPGVDPLAMARAAVVDLASRRIVSGASTLTMQLARLVRPHRRNFWGKFREMALALRIEASLTKPEIAEEYLNRAPFGAGVRGLEAASRYYFDKPPLQLSLAESATLMAIPRGPTLYNLRTHPERVLRRRDRILERMREAGWISDDVCARARDESLTTQLQGGSFGAPHFVRALGTGAIDSPIVGQHDVSDVVTTLDRRLQQETEASVRTMLKPLASRHVTAASVVVIDNASDEVVAYVGSPDYFNDPIAGQNDGVLARRQPGSALKPFVYALAMDRLGYTPATLLPDVFMHFEGAATPYVPMNYDERYHGPVRLRDALANSFNVPAVWTAEQVGVGGLLAFLRQVGFATLTESPEVYGMAIALGDGEVRLIDLARAYAIFARRGLDRPLRFVRNYKARGETKTAPLHEGEGRRLVPADVAAMITDVLRDKRARIGSFGDSSAFDLPFEVAVKTGTSKHYRDNWCVGYTRERTVAVWVGNFDGSSMAHVSGITGAAPLFRSVMEAAMRGIAPAPLAIREGRSGESLTQVAICPLSGGLASPLCPYSTLEWVPRAALPLVPCSMHEKVAIDRSNGLRAGPRCPPHAVEQRVFERYEPQFVAWAHTARRNTAPLQTSPRCPDSSKQGGAVIRIGAPRDGSHFLIDPDRPRSQQELSIRVEASSEIDRVDVMVDGTLLARVTSPYVAYWPLAPGAHVIEGRLQDGARGAQARIWVEPPSE